MKIAQQQPKPLQAALKRLTQGQYYAGRTEEVLGKSEAALDGFVGPAMNILHDTEERDVSRRGEELSLKLRKSARYLDRGQKNQEAFNGAVASALPLLDDAVSQMSEAEDKRKLEAARAEVAQLAHDPVVETALASLMNGYETDGQPRLAEVQSDTDGMNVSHHGRPLWNLFETSMVGLSDTKAAVRFEQTTLDSIVSRLQSLDRD